MRSSSPNCTFPVSAFAVSCPVCCWFWVRSTFSVRVPFVGWVESSPERSTPPPGIDCIFSCEGACCVEGAEGTACTPPAPPIWAGIEKPPCPGAASTAGPPASAPYAHEENAKTISAAAKNFVCLKVITSKNFYALCINGKYIRVFRLQCYHPPNHSQNPHMSSTPEAVSQHFS